MSGVSLDRLHELAGEVASRLVPGQLLVRVVKLDMSSQEPQGGNVSVDAQISLMVSSPTAHQSSLACTSTYTVVARKTDDHDALMWQVVVAVSGQWGLDSTDGLQDAHARAFAIKVAVMTLHPYARTQIQNAVLATGWPAYVLDVLQSPESIFTDEEGRVDLEGIGLFPLPSDSS